MLDRLPDQIEPLGLADVGRSFRGELAISCLSRLAGQLRSVQGDINVVLNFAIDERCIRTLTGSVTGQVTLACQRCLGDMEFPVDIKLRLGIVQTEDEADRLPAGYEMLLATGDPVIVAELIEDELILALPIVPKHLDSPECKPSAEALQLHRKKDNPFAVLKTLKLK